MIPARADQARSIRSAAEEICNNKKAAVSEHCFSSDTAAFSLRENHLSLTGRVISNSAYYPEKLLCLDDTRSLIIKEQCHLIAVVVYFKCN